MDVSGHSKVSNDHSEKDHSIVSPLLPVGHSRRQSDNYDVTATMDRLRSSLMGDMTEGKWTSDVIAAPPLSNGTTDDKNESVDDFSPLRRRGSLRVSQKRIADMLRGGAYQIPAIVLVGIFHLMVGIPFGVSYFPIGWRQMDKAEPDDVEDSVNGPFPLPGKEALGIRMFLFSTIIGQIAFTFFSGFHNPIGLQMVENVPFCHELSKIAIKYQGYSIDALSTLFVMFGISSVIVGVVFYLLGHYKLGRVVYYFPKHVLVGCIGGIGVFIAKTGIEVTIDTVFSLRALIEKFNLLGVVLIFEVVLRILERATRDEQGKAKYALLSPIYFCSITPIFYVALWICRVHIKDAMDAGYFFPSLDECDPDSSDCSSSFRDSLLSEDLFNIWTVIDLPTVSVPAIVNSIPTMVALILFSLIHVPINIPAFAISSGADVDMNQELVSHGYSNVIAGIFGGLQNYMAYTQSVIYHKSGGTGKASGIAVALLTSFLFFVGPTIASFIPRCMAGCLLLHVGIDLFLEGVYDSYGQFDRLEYAGIWLITIVMSLYGMEAAMIAGFVAATSIYAAQDMSYVSPIRGTMSATTLRSSHFQRGITAQEILSDPKRGRSRIFVVQMQGHLFFGNMAQISDEIGAKLAEKHKSGIGPWIVIVDFSLVLGIDSSAAHAITKLKNVMQKDFTIDLCIFVSGSSRGFPTDFNLTKELSACHLIDHLDLEMPNEATGLLYPPKVAKVKDYSGSHVCYSLDEALIFAENALLTRESPSLVEDSFSMPTSVGENLMSLSDERAVILRDMLQLAPKGTDPSMVEKLLSVLERETYQSGEWVWKQGSESRSAKYLLSGQLIAELEDEAGTQEKIARGNILGELGLVEGCARMSSVRVTSEEAVMYSLSRDSYEQLARDAPNAAWIVDKICIRYLSGRVQHVSNRIFETRCIPI